MEQVRSFIAIELPSELKQALVQLQNQLKAGAQHWIKWVDPYGIHLTLKFLGNVSVEILPGITRAMEKAADGIPPFHLEVKELGAFPNLKRVQVVWIGLGGEVDKLSQLQQQIESNLVSLGFAAESRPFVPHLTLARLREQVPPGERQKFGQLIASIKLDAVHSIHVDAIRLMRSQLTREGAIYSRISLVGLRNPLSTAEA